MATNKKTRAKPKARRAKKPAELTFTEPIQRLELAATADLFANAGQVFTYAAERCQGMARIYGKWSAGKFDPNVPVENKRVDFLGLTRPGLERAKDELDKLLAIMPEVPAELVSP